MSFPTAHPQHLACIPRRWPRRKVHLSYITVFGLCLLPYLGHAVSRLGATKRAESVRFENLGVRAARHGNSSTNSINSRHLMASFDGPQNLQAALEQSLARPLSLAAADFNEDGVPDLVSGYSSDGGGIITLQFGNVDSIYPNSPEAKEREVAGNVTRAPFLTPAHIFEVPIAPDFIGAGDFDADGHWDLVVAARGKELLSVSHGDGQGKFGKAKHVDIPGVVTALVTGEINRPDGLTDLVVAVDGKSGSKALVFEGPAGALKADPESFTIPVPASSLALGQLTSAYTIDLAVAAGRELMLVYGRDRKLTLTGKQQDSVRPARIERRSFSGAVKSLVIGNFEEDPQTEMAILIEGGEVQLLKREVPKRRSPGKHTPLTGWLNRDVQSPWPGAEKLIVANVSTSVSDDLLLLDSTDGQVRVLRSGNESKASVSALLEMNDPLSSSVAGTETVAVLPMRLDTDALTDLVMLRQNHVEPVTLLTTKGNPGPGRTDFSEALKLPKIHSNDAWRSSGSAVGAPQKSPPHFVARSGVTQSQSRVKASAKGPSTKRLLGACPTSPIDLGQTVNGTLATTDCFLDDGNYVDVYTFSGTTNQQVSVTLDSAAFDAYLYLLAPDGSLLSSDDDGGGGTNSQIPTAGGFITLPASGTYTIYATSFEAEELGDYSISLSGPGGGGPCPATPILTEPIVGTLSLTDCVFTSGPRAGSFVDVYTFSGSVGQEVAIGMVSNDFDTYLYLIAPTGALLAENDDVQPGETNSRIPPSGTITLQANGVYTIYATSFTPQVVGNYGIALNLITPPAFSTVVTNTNDSGPGSLRQAILNSNANQGVDTISFQIGTVSKTISPLTALPEVTDPVVIDGTTQPGFAGIPLIELDGQFTPQGTPGLKIIAGSSRVRGLVINGFGLADCNVALNVDINVGSGIVLASAGNNIIDGNFIGTNLSGTSARCNSGNGVFMFNSSNNTIGGTTVAARNIISGNRLPGIAIGGEFSNGNMVQGNYVGTNVTGTGDVGNRSNGMIVINGTSHVIGGAVAGAGNVVSGNDSPGIALGFSDPAGILVQGNFIGTNAAGNAAIPNLGGGIIVGGFFQLNGDPITATDNTIGGTTPTAGNVISGNLRFPGDPNPDGGNGVEIINEGSQRNKVQGNFIGLNAQGNAALPNAGSGVFITRAPNNFIGGVLANIAGTTNYIAANGRYGVGVGIRRLNDENPGQFITGGDAVDVVFNVIGTDPTQTLRLGNTLDGVYVDADSVDIYCNSNVIAFNGRSGVRIPDANGVANDNDNSGRLVNLDLNYIFGNTSRAVDLGFEGITLNDPGDADGGANLQQNFPHLASSSISLHEDPQEVDNRVSAAMINVTGTLNSSPNTSFTVHWYFSSDAQCVSGQAASRPLVFGRVPNVNTDTAGDASFSIPLDFPAGLTSGIINCSATDPQGNTSEYSSCFAVSAGGNPTPTPTPTPTPMTIQFASATASVHENGGSASVTVSRLGNNSGAATVDYTTGDLAGLANCNVLNSGYASSRCDYPTTIGRLQFAAGETSKTISVLVVDDGYVEGNEHFTVTLRNAVGASLGAPATVTVTINDNDTVNANPLDQAGFFARQHYLDFFSREPDAAGLGFWTNQITSCGSDTACIEIRRINVSAAFFLSIEFQQTGYLVYRMYKAAYGNLPGGAPVPVKFNEFLPDTQQIGLGVVVGQPGWEQLLENNKNLFAADFVVRQRFTDAYPTTRTPEQFVDALFTNAGVVPTATERMAAIGEFGGATNSADPAARGRALRRVAEHPTLGQQEFNKAFVLMQYLGYLRRNPNDAPDGNFDGYNFWLGKLNQFNGNFVSAEMVKAFILAGEYKQRFGP
jgi:Calx-beta domain/Bacterial pre-peptidase C-terminal domain